MEESRRGALLHAFRHVPARVSWYFRAGLFRITGRKGEEAEKTIGAFEARPGFLQPATASPPPTETGHAGTGAKKPGRARPGPPSDRAARVDQLGRWTARWDWFVNAGAQHQH